MGGLTMQPVDEPCYAQCRPRKPTTILPHKNFELGDVGHPVGCCSTSRVQRIQYS